MSLHAALNTNYLCLVKVQPNKIVQLQKGHLRELLVGLEINLGLFQLLLNQISSHIDLILRLDKRQFN